MDSKYKIREAVAADVDSILAIWLQGAEKSTGRTLDGSAEDSCHRFFSDRVSTQTRLFKFWVACDADDKVIGWQSLQPYSNNPLAYDKNALSSTFVQASSGHGMVGLSLLRYALNHARDAQMEFVWGVCHRNNEAAKLLLEATNFQKVGDIPPPCADSAISLEVWVFLPQREGAWDQKVE